MYRCGEWGGGNLGPVVGGGGGMSLIPGQDRRHPGVLAPTTYNYQHPLFQLCLESWNKVTGRESREREKAFRNVRLDYGAHFSH